MSSVDTRLANQLVNASTLAYADGLDAIRHSPYFTSSKLIDNSQLTQFKVGIDSVLMGQTATDVVIAFRGTMPPDQADPTRAIAAAEDWLNDDDLFLTTVNYSAGRVHTGFARSLDNLWNPLSGAIQSANRNGGKIYVTGHSKGGALAALAALRLISQNVSPASVITFGAPRTGDENFAAAYSNLMPNHWRFEHRNDIVPHLPPRPAVFQFLKLLGRFKGLSDLLKKIHLPIGDYTSVGNMCFLDWNNKLDQEDTTALEFEREGRLIIAGEELVTDHFTSAYIETMQLAFGN